MSSVVAHSDIGLPARTLRAQSLLARFTLRTSFIAIVVVSMAPLNEALIMTNISLLQQAASIALWMAIAISAASLKPLLRRELGTDTLALFAFYGFAVASMLWSDSQSASAMKSAALALTCFCGYFLATRLTLQEIISDVNLGLFALTAGSLVAVAMFPAISIDQSWSHEGNWQGILASKQGLGIAGALAMFCSAYQWMVRKNHFWCALTFLAGAACAYGSESRGGGALALAACFCLYLAARSPGIARLLSFAPLGLALAAGALMAYFYVTGSDSLALLGTKIDFTQRTFIWQHALALFGDRPFLGYGLNGFWTDKEIYLAFERTHGWVLDNFHSGYVAILTETGLVGYGLFLMTTLLVGMRLAGAVTDRSMPRLRIVALIGFTTLVYMINLTETIFLRSTSLVSTLIFIFLVNATLPYSEPVRVIRVLYPKP